MDTTVESSITQLAALQELDRHRREKDELVQVLETEIAELAGELLRQREATQAVVSERDAAETRRRELEAHLETEEIKMKDRRMRLNRVRNEKELQALRREIEVAKEANQQVEEELLSLLETLETLAPKATDAERNLAELETASAEKIAERGARVKELLAEGARECERRERMAESLDSALRQKYEQIFQRRGGTAVVEVRNGTCQGCHMNLPPQFFNELQRSREVRLCPNCHRILYWRPERLDPADPAR